MTETERKIKMKKLAVSLAALTFCAMLAGCSGKNDNASSETTVAETTLSDTMTEETSSEETSSEEASEETSEETSESEEASGDSAEAGSLKDIAEKLIEAHRDDLPDLELSEDNEFNKEFFLLDADNANYEDMVIYNCPMSAVMSEIIIIKAADGQIDAVKADLEARQKKAQEQDAFYPDDIDAANASIVGTKGNYAYFLLAFDVAPELEKTLNDLLPE